MADRHTTIFGDQIDASVLGDGLVKDVNDNIKVNVDDSTVEISADVVQVKAGGIDTAQLAIDAVDNTILDLAGTFNFNTGGGDIIVNDTPATSGSVVNKNYVDSIAQGLQIKDSVRVATSANITLSGTQTIDGITLIAGDRVLVKDQTTGSENGIYVVASGAWTRATDYAVGDSVKSTFMFVEEGTSLEDTGWVCTNDASSDIVGTDALIYAQFSSAGTIVAGNGLTKTGNTLDVNVDDSTTEINGSDQVIVKDAGITTAKINNDAVDKDKIASDVAGLGLGQNIDGSLEVNVDDVTIGIDTDTIEVKDGGIDTLQLADEAVSEVKLDVFNAPTVGYYMKFTANGLEWVDLDGDVVSESDFIFHEIPSGLINSTNVTYTLANTPVVGTVCVFLNGMLQAPGAGLDYTISGSTITFVKGPRTNSDLYVNYIIS